MRPYLKLLITLLAVSNLLSCATSSSKLYEVQRSESVRHAKGEALQIANIEFLPPYTAESRSQWKVPKVTLARAFKELGRTWLATSSVEFVSIDQSTPPRTKVAWITIYRVAPAFSDRGDFENSIIQSAQIVAPPGVVKAVKNTLRNPVSHNGLDCVYVSDDMTLAGSPKFKQVEFSYFSVGNWCLITSDQNSTTVAEITFSERVEEGLPMYSTEPEIMRFIGSLKLQAQESDAG